MKLTCHHQHSLHESKRLPKPNPFSRSAQLTVRRLQSLQTDAAASSSSPALSAAQLPTASDGTHHPSSFSRRLSMAAAVASCLAGQCIAGQPAAAAAKQVDPQLIKAFQEAMAATTYEDMEAAWTKAIELSPTNTAARSNRGTIRLQYGHWQAAYEDLQAALELEQQQTGSPSAILLNNLGNAEGALGRWSDAMVHYKAAADDADVGSIALANYALAAFETGDDGLAIKSARQLLRRDPEFLDSRCALTAFLWGSGRRSDAEDTWEQLQQSADGLGAAMYSRATAVERVRHRWPPRATAALVAFLNLSDVGQAEGYDLQMHEYRFGLKV